MPDVKQRDELLRVVAEFLHKQGVGDGACAVDDALKEIERLREALEIAHDALERTNRDDKFGYEDKKAAEDYIRGVLNAS